MSVLILPYPLLNKSLNKCYNVHVAVYHGAGVNRSDGMIRSGSKNSGKVWKSSKFVYHTVQKAEFKMFSS